MKKEVVIIGGGHMGMKMLNLVQGKYNVVMVDTPNVQKKHTELFRSWEGGNFYIATPDETHADWILCTPQHADVLVEKPLVYNLYQFRKVTGYAEINDINIVCNLPWRTIFDKLAKLQGLERVILQRSQDWMYQGNFKWERPPIGIDIGVHMFDLVGEVVGRSQLGFDEIIFNEVDVFEAIYKGVRIRLEFTISGGKNIVQFRDWYSRVEEWDSVMPEEWILENYDLWLAGETKSFATYSELKWLQTMLEEVHNGYYKNRSGCSLFKCD